MRQEVNLYTVDFRRGEQTFSSRIVVRAGLCFFALLMVIEAIVAFQLVSARGTVERLEQEQQTVAARLQTLKASQPFSAQQQLQADIEKMHTQVRRREELKSLISSQNLGNADGFSPYMEAMARQASVDVSLTQIRLLNGGDYLELGGWTRRPESVPLYLRKLRNENSFQKVKFGVLGIKKDESINHKLQFSLGKPEEESS